MEDREFIMPPGSGSYAGASIYAVPSPALRAMVREQTEWAGEAAEEIERRGPAAVPSVDITPHAVDRASQRLWRRYRETRLKEKDEGLHTWLRRMVSECIARVNPQGIAVHPEGVKFVLSMDGQWPALVTCSRVRKARKVRHGRQRRSHHSSAERVEEAGSAGAPGEGRQASPGSQTTQSSPGMCRQGLRDRGRT